MNILRRIVRSVRYRSARLADSLDFDTRMANRIRGKRISISHGSLKLNFAVPNVICRFRARTFSFKEPETLAWIDRFESGTVFWDVGANVGLYSIYAAKARGCEVYAFEPSVFNLEFLARNANLNGLAGNVHVVPVALGARTGTGTLHMSSTEWGGALSTFDKTYGSDGKELSQVFKYSTVAIRMDEAVSHLGLPAPHYIKIDVDGIEHLILAGGARVLESVRGVLVEISNEFQEQADLSRECLERAGLVLKEAHLDNLAGDSASSQTGTGNQIWARPKELLAALA